MPNASLRRLNGAVEEKASVEWDDFGASVAILSCNSIKYVTHAVDLLWKVSITFSGLWMDE